MVGDDAVVDDGELARGPGDVRVRVGGGGGAVRRPASVGDAGVRRELPVEVEARRFGFRGGEGDEGVDFARGLEDRRRGPEGCRARGAGLQGRCCRGRRVVRSGGSGQARGSGRRAQGRDVPAAALEPRGQGRDRRVRPGVVPRGAPCRGRGDHASHRHDLGPVAVDGDARGVVAAVLEAAQASEEQVEDLAARARDLVIVVAEDAAHRCFFARSFGWAVRRRSLPSLGAGRGGKKKRERVWSGAEMNQVLDGFLVERFFRSRSFFFFEIRGDAAARRFLALVFGAFPVSSSRSNAWEAKGTSGPRYRARERVGKREGRRNARRRVRSKKRERREKREEHPKRDGRRRRRGKGGK